MSALDLLEKKDIKELLSKGWITHDAMWFAHSLSEIGIERTNVINKAAIKSMAVIEVGRLRKALGFKKNSIDTFDDLRMFMESAMDIVLAEFMHFSFSVPEKNVFRWKLDRGNCFAYKGISSMGAIDHYECGVLYRIETWLKALNVNYEMKPAVTTCIMHSEGNCSGEFVFNLA